jgi:hypothetical protein
MPEPISQPRPEGGDSMTHKSLHQLLRVASHLLDQAAADIRAADLAPVPDNIQRIGRALIEVIEVQRQIYTAQPELQPKSLAASPRELEANRLFTQFTLEALELEDAGDPEAAREKYTEFIGLSPSYPHREIARAEIRRLS